jgi:diadenosine tetraphosphate (Ap4A) HIT family hydrolase
VKRRPPPDLDAYLAGARARCFLCELAAGTPEHPHHLVYEDESAIAFLNRFPTVAGYTLVAPREHREQVTGDFDDEEYLELQRVVHRVSEAVRRATSAERVYLLSLGSQQANRHVHWHVVPCPPGLPFERQQLALVDWELGLVDLSDEEMSAIAERIRAEL